MVPDAVHRHPAVLGVDVFHLQLLLGLAEGAVPENLVSHAALPTASDGTRHWLDHHQQQSCAGGARWSPERIRAHPEISRCEQGGEIHRREKVPQTPWLGSLC